MVCVVSILRVVRTGFDDGGTTDAFDWALTRRLATRSAPGHDERASRVRPRQRRADVSQGQGGGMRQERRLARWVLSAINHALSAAVLGPKHAIWPYDKGHSQGNGELIQCHGER